MAQQQELLQVQVEVDHAEIRGRNGTDRSHPGSSEATKLVEQEVELAVCPSKVSTLGAPEMEVAEEPLEVR